MELRVLLRQPLVSRRAVSLNTTLLPTTSRLPPPSTFPVLVPSTLDCTTPRDVVSLMLPPRLRTSKLSSLATTNTSAAPVLLLPRLLPLLLCSTTTSCPRARLLWVSSTPGCTARLAPASTTLPLVATLAATLMVSLLPAAGIPSLVWAPLTWASSSRLSKMLVHLCRGRTPT